MSQMTVVVWSLAGLFTLGCASPTAVGIRSLADEGADNELALAEKYEGELLRVTGRVEKVGYSRREVINVEYFAGSATGTKGYEERPYVAVSPVDGQGDTLLFCFFAVDERAQPAGLRRNQPITLDGTYGAFRTDKGVAVLSLYECSIAD